VAIEPFPFRLLKTGANNGAYNMALDEALLESVASGGLPVLRLYGWNPPAVSLGYFQGLEEEVDTEACRRRGIDVVRRISGGGAVFHDAELTYTLILPAAHPLAAASIGGSYEKLCSGVIAGLALLGIDAAFAPINDIIAGPGAEADAGKKISGSAQTRRQGCILQHGTVLLDLDAPLMFTLLRVPREKLPGRPIGDLQTRTSSLRALLGRPVPSGDAEDALINGFRGALSLNYVTAESAPTPTEEARAQILTREKFAAESWLRRR
jgi:lipoate-protein ligase A